MKPFRTRLARAIALALLLLLSLGTSVALADSPISDVTTVPEDPGFLYHVVP